MMTIAELLTNKPRTWAKKPPLNIMGADYLLWFALNELASMLELTFEPRVMIDVTPEALEILRRGADHFAKDGMLMPQSVALVNLRVARVAAGLDEN